MAAFMLKSLVLRGWVRQDALAVSLRLGFGAKANPRALEIRNSSTPSSVWRKPDTQTVMGPDVGYPTEGTMPGAGRSRRQLGSRLLPGAARTTRRPVLLEWPTFTEETSAVPASHRAIPACLASAAPEASPLCLATRPVSRRENEGR
jgi:hypothetical protein